MHGYMCTLMGRSATNATRDSVAESIVYLQGGQQIENSAATGKHCTNYDALKALEQGASIDEQLSMTSHVKRPMSYF